jgi:acyl-coenzyme A thioesterase PaaI-like protein
MTTIDQLNARGQGLLPGLFGIEFTSIEPGKLTSRLTLRPELLAPNGYLHAATIIALADTTYGSSQWSREFHYDRVKKQFLKYSA